MCVCMHIFKYINTTFLVQILCLHVLDFRADHLVLDSPSEPTLSNKTGPPSPIGYQLPGAPKGGVGLYVHLPSHASIW